MSKSMMSKSVTDRSPHVWSTDEVIGVLVTCLLGLTWGLGALAWVSGGLVALATHGSWPDQPFSASFSLPIRLAVHWDERTLAWPADDRSILGPDWCFWSGFFILVVAAGTVVTMAVTRISRSLAQYRRTRPVKARKEQRDKSSIWARPADLESLVVPDRNTLTGRVYLASWLTNRRSRWRLRVTPR